MTVLVVNDYGTVKFKYGSKLNKYYLLGKFVGNNPNFQPFAGNNPNYGLFLNNPKFNGFLFIAYPS